MAGATGLEPAASCVTGHRSADNRKSDFLINECLRPRPFLRLSGCENTCAAVSNLSNALAQALALTFPDISLFIQAVRNLERKIGERLRSSTPRIAANR
jgi:hypothetical protein